MDCLNINYRNESKDVSRKEYAKRGERAISVFRLD
nr:MAG TPA: hypothetical protein [Bacteriophage sp.]